MAQNVQISGSTCSIKVAQNVQIKWLKMFKWTAFWTNFLGYNQKNNLSHDAASGSAITPCNKIDKLLVVYRFYNVMFGRKLWRCVKDGKILTFSHQKWDFQLILCHMIIESTIRAPVLLNYIFWSLNRDDDFLLLNQSINCEPKKNILNDTGFKHPK